MELRERSLWNKKRFVRPVLRTIRESLGRYMALLFITALGVSFFLGMKLTRLDMQETLERYVDEQNMYDLCLISPGGIDEKTWDRIRKDMDAGRLPWVSDMEAERSADVLLEKEGESSVLYVRLIECPQRINRPRLSSGTDEPFAGTKDEAAAPADRAKETTGVPSGETREKTLPVLGDAVLLSPVPDDTFPAVSGKEEADRKAPDPKIFYPTYRLSDKNEPSVSYMFKDRRIMDRVFDVCGTVRSPIYIGPDRGESSIGGRQRDGYLYVPAGTLSVPVYSALYFSCRIPKGAPAGKEKGSIMGWKEQMEAYVSQSLSGSRWIVLSRLENPGYAKFISDTSIVSEIADLFPVFFAVIVVLVCVTSMLRLVTEERGQIGVQKAMGVPDRVIRWKYMAYSLSAVFFGWASGSAFGGMILPQIFWMAYGSLYDFSPLRYHPASRLIWTVFLVSMAIPLVSTRLICARMLRHEPAVLLRPAAPRAGKKIWLERCWLLWKSLSFLEKSIWRNLLRYKLRLLMMLTGIGGCTALLLTGFGLRDSMIPVTDRQYGQIVQYNLEARLSSDEPDLDLDLYRFSDSALQIMKSAGRKADAVSLQEEASEKISRYDPAAGIAFVRADTGAISVVKRRERRGFPARLPGIGKRKGEKKSVRGRVLAADPGSVEGFLNIHTVGDTVDIDADQSVLVDKATADYMDIGPGDLLSVSVNGKQADVSVKGVFENYIGSLIVFTTKSHAHAFGPEEANTVLIKSADPKDLLRSLESEKIFAGFTLPEKRRQDIDRSLSCLDGMVLLIAFFAAALEFIVIYNLTVIHLAERIREIATVQVLGFYPSEVKRYILRENIYTSIGAAILGLAGGYAAHGYVMSKLVIEGLAFPRQISLLSVCLAFACTILFAVVTNSLMARSIKKIPMAESLKSVD